MSRLRLITYNIRKGKGANGRAQVGMEALASALAEHQPDLILCQEVFHCDRTGDSQSGGLAQNLGLRSYYGGNKFRAIGHHGNTTLTGMEVDHVENHDISTNRVERRGALYLRTRLAERPLHVFNVHLGLNGFQRRQQLKRIGELIDTACRDGDPVIVAGDFNDWRHELEPLVVDELGLHNALGAHDRQAVRTWHARRPVFALDRIYVRNLQAAQSIRLEGEPWSQLSDHLPLLADLEPAG